jgi:hypothetical protein
MVQNVYISKVLCLQIAHHTIWTLETYAISKPQRERERERDTHTHTYTYTLTITVDAVVDFLAAYIKAKRNFNNNLMLI